MISWCSLLLEFLENSWNFETFFQGPGKPIEKQMITLNSWKTPGILKYSFRAWKTPGKQIISLYYLQNSLNFVENFLYANQNQQKHLTHDCTFRIYVDSISVARTWQKLLDIVLFLPRENLRLGRGK